MTPPPDRPAFNEIVQTLSLQFARDLLASVPELEGLAIVPSYKIAQPNMPFGFMLGHNGPLRTPNEIMHMATQLHANLQHVLNNAQETIRAYDQQMGALAAKLAELANKQSEVDDGRAA